MSERSEQERLLIHDTVATTVDTIIAAIDAEINRVIDPNTEPAGLTRAMITHRNGVLDGLRTAKGAAAVASVAARAAATHVERAVA